MQLNQASVKVTGTATDFVPHFGKCLVTGVSLEIPFKRVPFAFCNVKVCEYGEGDPTAQGCKAIYC